MPRKQIYVREEDAQLFEKAEQLLGDNFSATVAEALRRLVEVKEAETQGMKEHTLEVGIWTDQGDNDIRKIKFFGRLLAEGEKFTGQTSTRDDRGTDYEIYQTKAGKILIWWKNWTRWQNHATTADYVVRDDIPDFNDSILGQAYDIAEGPLPGNILSEAAEALGQEMVEYIE